jgi:hypothetical protein
MSAESQTYAVFHHEMLGRAVKACGCWPMTMRAEGYSLVAVTDAASGIKVREALKSLSGKPPSTLLL